MIQNSLLDSDGKMILDATCSYRRIWPKFATVRIDVRPETKPDVVMDAKKSDSKAHFMTFIPITKTMESESK